jgi:hypothetical protein
MAHVYVAKSNSSSVELWACATNVCVSLLRPFFENIGTEDGIWVVLSEMLELPVNAPSNLNVKFTRGFVMATVLGTALKKYIAVPEKQSYRSVGSICSIDAPVKLRVMEQVVPVVSCSV